MTDSYDAAKARLDTLKRDYAAYQAQAHQRRKPMRITLAVLCLLLITGVLVAAGYRGAGAIVGACAGIAFVAAYRVRERNQAGRLDDA